MRVWHICFMFALTFFWIWSLPILIAGVFLCAPIAIVSLPLCLAISLFLQYIHHDTILAKHPVRRWISRIPWHEWFPCNRLHFTDTCIVAVHPHGVLCCGAIAGIHFVPGSKTVLCVAPILFYVPVMGWLLRVLACIPATKTAMQNALRDGHSLLVVPGGVPEIVLAETGDDTQRFARHGILRLQPKVPVHVVFVRGECSTFRMWQGPFLRQRVWLSWRLNIPFVMPILLGHYGTWLPRRQPLTLASQEVDPANKETYKKVLEKIMKNILMI